MDLNKITEEFGKLGFTVEILSYSEINFRERSFKNQIIFYTSSEDVNLYYKSYVEDIIYALDLQGAVLLPPYKLLKAHHNKVFMEFLRDLSNLESIKGIKTNHFGTLEDFLGFQKELCYPLVFKSASGAVSSGVAKPNNRKQAIKIIKKHARSFSLRHDFWDFGRFLRHKGYQRESLYRKKFILQSFIPNMDKDWKVIIYGKKYFVLERSVRKGDFRASGSGLIQYNEKLPEGLLDFSETFFNSMKVPFLAMDIGFSNENFVLIEFQAINFGTHTVDTAPFYFQKIDSTWQAVYKEVIVENEFVSSVFDFLNETR
jgi:glutathione synthase/RimK-type ligase-like ATP-grasp enzyme